MIEGAGMTHWIRSSEQLPDHLATVIAFHPEHGPMVVQFFGEHWSHWAGYDYKLKAIPCWVPMPGDE
jgi:hypothetical protein